ncbi:MAG: SWIM zinc finger family protein, partial [Chloroflexota bacterium]
TTGTAFTGKLVFYPSQYPLRAYVHHIANEGRASTSTAWESIHDCIDRYSQALSTNPWIHEFPCMLQAVIPTRIDEDWVLREEDGTYLPIMPDYADKWVLLALSGGHPIQIGGTWDGASFYPMTAVAENRWVNLKRLENL